MTCSKCNTQNPEGTSFCTSCGNPLVNPSVQTTTPPTPVSTVYAPQVPVQQSDSVVLPVVVGFLLGGPIGAVVAYLIWRSSWEKSKKIKVSIIAYVILFLLVAGFLAVVWGTIFLSALRSGQFPAGGGENVLSTPAETTAPISLGLEKYSLDTDGDGIPDSVEVALGYDPKVTVADECRHKLCGSASDETGGKPTNILLVLDASGSMVQMVGNERKIDIAKRVIKDYASKIPVGTNLGLMVYGNHGSNSPADKAVSCAGIDLVYPVGSINISQFNSAVDSFQPTGWTPIGGSLRKAVTTFSGKEGQNNFVIVVTDGEETCQSDPVGAAKDLRASNIKAQIDVVGFSVNASIRAQLEQIAQAGGGKYTDANSATDLANSFNSKRFWELVGIGRCLLFDELKFQTCVQDDHYSKAMSYYRDLELKLPLGSVKETDFFENLIHVAYDKDQAILQESYKNYNQQQQENTNQLFGTPSPTP